jgi:flagellar motor switch protein FliN
MSDEAPAGGPAFLLPEFPEEKAVGQAGNAAPRGRVSDIPVEIQAVIGKARVSVAQLMAAGEGSHFKLDARFGDPVEIQVNGQTIGYGELVGDDRSGIVGIRMISVRPIA